MNKKIITVIAVIVVVVLVGWAIFAVGYHGGASQTQSQPPAAQNNPSAQSQPEQPTAAVTPAAGLYASSADGFSVNFPTTPQVIKSTFNSPSAGSVPVTKYIAQSGSGASAKYYVIYVYHYPSSYQFPAGYLTGAMDLFAMAVSAKYPTAKLTSQQPTQLLGNAAEAGTITVTAGGQQSENYLVITTKNHNTYGIGTYGMSQSDYNAFVSSFTFTQ